jgi:hypothetical protein
MPQNVNTNTQKTNVVVNVNSEILHKKKPRKPKAKKPNDANLPNPEGQTYDFKMNRAYGAPRGQIFYPSITRIYNNSESPIPNYFSIPLTNMQNTMDDMRTHVGNQLQEVNQTLSGLASTPEEIRQVNQRVEDLRTRFESTMHQTAMGQQEPPSPSPSTEPPSPSPSTEPPSPLTSEGESLRDARRGMPYTNDEAGYFDKSYTNPFTERDQEEEIQPASQSTEEEEIQPADEASTSQPRRSTRERFPTAKSEDAASEEDVRRATDLRRKENWTLVEPVLKIIREDLDRADSISPDELQTLIQTVIGHLEVIYGYIRVAKPVSLRQDPSLNNLRELTNNLYESLGE